MRSMLANIPVRLRNSKSCTREAVLRPLRREHVRARSLPCPALHHAHSLVQYAMMACCGQARNLF
jgi:BarA-like signal transduction histidine kinase